MHQEPLSFIKKRPLPVILEKSPSAELSNYKNVSFFIAILLPFKYSRCKMNGKLGLEPRHLTLGLVVFRDQNLTKDRKTPKELIQKPLNHRSLCIIPIS